MASPQTENGYTKFANELLEAFIRTRIPGQEIRIMLFIARKTYGYGKKQDCISYGQIAKATGIPRTRAIEHVKSLVSKRVLGSLNNGTRQPATIWINKDYEKWVPSPIKGTSPKEGTTPSPNKGTIPSPIYGTYKRKKEIKRNTIAHFQKFWAIYPKKKSKGNAEKAFFKISPSEQLLETMLSSIERAKTSEQWTEANGKFIPYPASWLNSKAWEDEEITEQNANLCKRCKKRPWVKNGLCRECWEETNG